MSLVGDVLQTHRQPGAIFRKRLATTSEASAFAILILALIISFLGRIPVLVGPQTAAVHPLPPALAATFIGGVLFGSLFIYALAAVLRFLMRGPQPGLQARVVVFWSLLVLAPWGALVNLLNARLAYPPLEILTWILLSGFLGFLVVTGHLAARAAASPQAVQS